MIPNNNDDEMMQRRENIPVIPLPNEGEGGPVFSGDEEMEENIPVTPLPTPEMNFPVFPGNGTNENRPVIPLPNPGEGGPVYTGGTNNMGSNALSNIISTIITSYPRPNAPCRFCMEGSRYGTIRFLNAASDYNPFMIYFNSDLFANPLNFAEVTDYERVSSGMQTISVLAQNGYIYLQKQLMIPQNKTVTIAIINTQSGLDLMLIQDQECSRPLQAGCIRACNLAVNSGPLNVVIGQRYITFMNLRYKDISEFENIWPGEYNYYVSKSRARMNNVNTMNSMNGMNNMNGMNSMNGMNNMNARSSMNGEEILLSSTLSVQMNVSYTIYLFHWNLASPDAIRALIIEER